MGKWGTSNGAWLDDTISKGRVGIWTPSVKRPCLGSFHDVMLDSRVASEAKRVLRRRRPYLGCSSLGSSRSRLRDVDLNARDLFEVIPQGGSGEEMKGLSMSYLLLWAAGTQACWWTPEVGPEHPSVPLPRDPPVSIPHWLRVILGGVTLNAQNLMLINLEHRFSWKMSKHLCSHTSPLCHTPPNI